MEWTDDQYAIYRLDREEVEQYLKELFGNWNFYVRVSWHAKCGPSSTLIGICADNERRP